MGIPPVRDLLPQTLVAHGTSVDLTNLNQPT